MRAYILKPCALLVFLCALTNPGHAQTKPLVVHIATGGTISMEIDPIKHEPALKISGEVLLALAPEVTNYVTMEVPNFTKLPSDYMDPVLWTPLTRAVTSTLNRPEVAGGAHPADAVAAKRRHRTEGPQASFDH